MAVISSTDVPVNPEKYGKGWERIFGRDENGLKQCPYDKACRCRMDEPCEGCETWARAIDPPCEHYRDYGEAPDGPGEWCKRDGKACRCGGERGKCEAGND